MEKIRNPLDHQFLFLIRKYHINGLEMHLLPITWRDDRPQRTHSNKSERHLLQQQCLVLIRMYNINGIEVHLHAKFSSEEVQKGTNSNE